MVIPIPYALRLQIKRQAFQMKVYEVFRVVDDDYLFVINFD